MLLIKMLTSTTYQGVKRKGMEYEVPKEVAIRWSDNGIAEVLSEFDEDGEDDYTNMTVKELYSLAKEQGLEVEPKKPKKYYIRKLRE